MCGIMVQWSTANAGRSQCISHIVFRFVGFMNNLRVHIAKVGPVFNICCLFVLFGHWSIVNLLLLTFVNVRVSRHVKSFTEQVIFIHLPMAFPVFAQVLVS